MRDDYLGFDNFWDFFRFWWAEFWFESFPQPVSKNGRDI